MELTDPNFKKAYNMKHIFSGKLGFMLAAFALLATACQKDNRPGLGDYPQDTNPPGGPLNFYVAFDGTTSNPLMNAVDSIRATFAGNNPLSAIDGVSGKAIQGVNRKYITYSKPNDWAAKAQSATIAFWFKHNGQTKNNKGGNGPEYVFSFKQTNVDGSNHWSGSTLLFFLEGDNAKGAVKVMMVDRNGADAWMTWEGGNTIAGLMDNKWHHMAFVYNAATSKATLYVDGVANAFQPGWGTHGPLNLSNDRIQEVRLGAGPAAAGDDTDDWLASTWKGELDQFRLYSTALTAAEIMALYTQKM